jgi:DNA-binding NarL/FixJ family response regulator
MDMATFPLWRGLIGSTRSPHRLSEVTQPVMLVHAENDPLFPMSGAQTLAAILPNATMHVMRASASLAPFTDIDAIELALEFRQAAPPLAETAARSEAGLLSSRELEVLHLIASGKTNGEIGRLLVISPSTVSHHVSNILAKTGAGNRTEAAAYAHRANLL